MIPFTIQAQKLQVFLSRALKRQLANISALSDRMGPPRSHLSGLTQAGILLDCTEDDLLMAERRGL